MPKRFVAEIPIPTGLPKCGSPNARCHWRQRHSQFRATRETAYLATISHLSRHPTIQIPTPCQLSVAWAIGLPRNANPRDLDNVVPSAKPILDGITDALGIDDRHVSEVSVNQYRSQSGDWEVVATIHLIEP